MKCTRTLLVLAALLLAGCKYESPLTGEHSISIDPAVLGIWAAIPDKGETPKQEERMIVLEYSDTEYLVHYPLGKDGIYYRAYPIKVGDVSCVQLQVIGTDEGPPKADEKELFQVVSYQLSDGELEVKTLNGDLVGDSLKTTAELAGAFLSHKDNAELFTDPGRFRRVEE